MKVYRYEYPDGGGPYYHLDGSPRGPFKCSFSDIYDPNNVILYGCASKQQLDQYAQLNKFPIEEMEIKEYNVDEFDILSYRPSNGHIEFRKR